MEWSRTYPRPPAKAFGKYNISHIDSGISFVQTSDGGYAILGSIEDSFYVGEHSGPHQNNSGIIIKTDSLGNLQWQKANPILSPSQLIFQTQNAGYLVISTDWLNDYLFEIDAQGNLQSNKTLGVSISSALQTSYNSYILVGVTEKASNS